MLGMSLLRPLLRQENNGFNRFFSTEMKRKRKLKVSTLTPYVSPLLLRLHPDTIQRHSPEFAFQNEQAMKQLNGFIELATLAVNDKAFQARKHILSLSTTTRKTNDPSSFASIRFPLVFYVPSSSSTTTTSSNKEQEFMKVKYIIEVPSRLVRQTFVSASSSSRRRREEDEDDDEESSKVSALAREWRLCTKKILKELCLIAGISLDEKHPQVAALKEWLEQEEDSLIDQKARDVAAHNRDMYTVSTRFEQDFHNLLTREKNIVHTTTTGLEDGPTTQHAVLTSLLSERLLLNGIPKENYRDVYFWIGNLLLCNFMELELHRLVWNKICLVVSKMTREEDNEEEEDPPIVRILDLNEDRPQDGMAIQINLWTSSELSDMDKFNYEQQLIELLYELVLKYDELLSTASTSATANTKRKPKRKRRPQKHRRGPHRTLLYPH